MDVQDEQERSEIARLKPIDHEVRDTLRRVCGPCRDPVHAGRYEHQWSSLLEPVKTGNGVGIDHRLSAADVGHG